MYVINTEPVTTATYSEAILDFNGTVTSGGKVVIDIEGYAFEYLSMVGDTELEVSEAFASMIAKHPWYTTTVNAGVVTIKGRQIGGFYNAIVITDKSTDTGVTVVITQFAGGTDATMEPLQTTLDNAIAIDSGFYAIALDRMYRTDIAQMTSGADWAEAHERIFLASTADKDVLDPAIDTDMASVFMDAGYNRTLVTYNFNPIEFVEVGAFAILATTSFTGINTVKTLKFKNIALATAENITGGELSVIQSKNCNVLVKTSGIRTFVDGITPGGDWLDVYHGADALAEQIRVNVFGALSRTSTKIPYTEKGMDKLKYEVERALLQYEANGFIAPALDQGGDLLPAYEIWSGRVIDASPVDKSNRVSPSISFKARVAGAVHSVQINGTLVL
jgi:hypothetical protein